jgi:hypothetical protein
MSTISKRTSPAPSLDPKNVGRVLGPYQAGVSLAPGDFVADDSNGLVQKATNATVGATGTSFAESKCDGVVVETFISGAKGVAVFGMGTVVDYGTSLTIGAQYYMGTGGAIQDTMPTAVDRPVAKAISATNILILR